MSGQPFNVLINEVAAQEFGFTAAERRRQDIFLQNTDVTVAGVLVDFKWDG